MKFSLLKASLTRKADYNAVEMGLGHQKVGSAKSAPRARDSVSNYYFINSPVRLLCYFFFVVKKRLHFYEMYVTFYLDQSKLRCGIQKI